MSTIPALVVRQWLRPEWDQVKYEPVPPRAKPEPQFYLFSISAYRLKRLTGIYRRDPSIAPAEDMGIQRRHDPDRSDEILRYLQDGFPLSRINRKKLVDPAEETTLRMPGWLPTAVVVNILTRSDERGSKGHRVAPKQLVQIVGEGESAVVQLQLPDRFEDDDWHPVIHPIEVIDGQHRLWALEEPEEDEDWLWNDSRKKRLECIEVPVVAFHGLDRTWQAYLFYTINQLPKKIDTSMVFDLYPLLRTEDWLLRFEGPNIYRQTRAQDLTILLWSHPESPWKERIIRLGGREKGKVTQAAFIHSLMASFIKRYRGGPRSRLGGMFGSVRGTHEPELGWGREQQAAFLIFAWQEIREATTRSNARWAKALLEKYRADMPGSSEADRRALLFAGPDTQLAADQGVRGYLAVMNDMLWVGYENGSVDLNCWDWVRKPRQNDEMAISAALRYLRDECPVVVKYVKAIGQALAEFDWRLPSALASSDPQYSIQAMYRGSSGYREIRRNMLLFLIENGSAQVRNAAEAVYQALDFESEED